MEMKRILLAVVALLLGVSVLIGRPQGKGASEGFINGAGI
jgi:hypothetical protein